MVRASDYSGQPKCAQLLLACADGAILVWEDAALWTCRWSFIRRVNGCDGGRRRIPRWYSPRSRTTREVHKTASLSLVTQSSGRIFRHTENSQEIGDCDDGNVGSSFQSEEVAYVASDKIIGPCGNCTFDEHLVVWISRWKAAVEQVCSEGLPV